MSNNEYAVTKISSEQELSHQSGLNQIANIGTNAIDVNINRRRNIIARLFPNAQDKALIEGQLALINTEYEFRKKALVLVRETHIQVLRETCNQYLVQGKAAGRAETTKFLMQKAVEIQAELERICDEFSEKIDRQLTKIEAIKHQRLREKREEELNRDIDNFFQMKNELIQKFINIVREGV